MRKFLPLIGIGALCASTSPLHAEQRRDLSDTKEQAQANRRQPVYQQVPASQQKPLPPAYRQPTPYERDVKWREFDRQAAFGISTGYRRDELKWNIAGNSNGTSPNILSELKWENLNIAEIKAKGEFRIPEGDLRNVYITGEGSYGYVVSGDNQDSDYFSDNRTDEFSRSNNSADGGNVKGVSGGIGYAFQWDKVGAVQLLRLIPLAGYTYNQQNMRIRDGVQTVTSAFAPPLGPFSGLDSQYNAKWHGPFLGLDMGIRVADRHSIRARGQYTWANYEGSARWNLRQDFRQPVSFEHEADGQGFGLSLQYAYALNEHIDMTLEGAFERWTTDAGKDITHTQSFGDLQTQLNEVDWDSKSIKVGLNYRY